MFWFVSALFVLGALCGVAIRMMIFVIVLLVAAAIVIAATATHGGGAILLNTIITLVTLQIGYAAGLILRTAVRSRWERSPTPHSDPVSAPFSEKRH
jgi:hypothetical protein